MTDAMLDTPPATPSPPASLAHGAPTGEQSSEGDRIVADRYRLIRKLGEGAMGAVFLAEHVHMRKRFALKLLLPEAMASPEIVARFEREAIAAGNIGHPGVCAATDFGRLEDGSFFLVLEYVDGRSLRHVVHEGAMPPERALSIARQVLAALGAAHAKGVVHRDIKPENVMLTRGASEGEDVVKVLDFGIAKVDANSLGEGQGTNLTRMGAIYGTPAYMAPEQAMGRAIDHRVDLYAVGVMLHEMIAGAPPFDGEGVVILAKHVHEPPPPLVSPIGADVSPDLAAFVARLLAKAPDARPADAQAAIAELDQARASLARFERLSILGGGATAPTFAGTASPLSAAPTMLGPAATPTPPPTAIANGPRTPPGPLDPVFALLEPTAKRLGVTARMLLVAVSAAFGLLVILVFTIAIVASRPKDTAEADDDAERPRRKPVAAASAEPTTNPPATAPVATTTTTAAGKPTASAAPSASTASKGGKGGKSQGGGLKNLGNKIKGLF